MPTKKNKWAFFLALFAPFINTPASPPPTKSSPPPPVESHIQYMQESGEFTGEDYGKSIFLTSQETAAAAEDYSTEQRSADLQEECSALRDETRNEITSILSRPQELISLVADIASLGGLGYGVIQHVLKKKKTKSPTNPFFDEFCERAILVLEFFKEFKGEPKSTITVLSNRTGIPKEELELLLKDLGFSKSGHYWTPPRPANDVLEEVRRLYRKKQLEAFLRMINLGNILKIAIIALEFWLIYRTIQNSNTVAEKIGNSILPAIILIATIYFVFFVFRSRRVKLR